jgi:hypothetical protein
VPPQPAVHNGRTIRQATANHRGRRPAKIIRALPLTHGIDACDASSEGGAQAESSTVMILREPGGRTQQFVTFGNRKTVK